MRLNPAISNQVINTIQQHHPEVIEAAQSHPQAFARLLGADPANMGQNAFQNLTTLAASTTNNDANSSAAPAGSQSEGGQSSGYASAVPGAVSSDPGSFQTPAERDTPMNDGSDPVEENFHKENFRVQSEMRDEILV